MPNLSDTDSAALTHLITFITETWQNTSVTKTSSIIAPTDVEANPNPKEEEKPLLSSAPTSSALTSNLATGSVYFVLFVLAVWGAYLYLEDGEAEATRIAALINQFTEKMKDAGAEYWLTALTNILSSTTRFATHYFSTITNAPLNAQVNILLYKAWREIFTRTEAATFLIGKENKYFWLWVILFFGPGAQLPFSFLAYMASNTVFEKAFSLSSTAPSILSYFFGASIALSRLQAFKWLQHILPKSKIDETENGFSSEAKEKIDANRLAISNRIIWAMSSIVDNYKNSLPDERKFKTASEFKKQLDELTQAAPDQQQKKLANFLENFLVPIQQERSLSNKILDFVNQLKSGAIRGATLVCMFGMLINDIATAYSAGERITDVNVLKQLLGVLFGLTTGVSVGGFTYSSFVGLFHPKEPTTDKKLAPGFYYPLVIALVAMAIFSGGPSALEAVMNLPEWEKAPWIRNLFEAFGYLGADAVNIPYVMDFAAWLIQTVYKKCFADENTRNMLDVLGTLSELNSTFLNMKYGVVDKLMEAECFQKFVSTFKAAQEQASNPKDSASQPAANPINNPDNNPDSKPEESSAYCPPGCGIM